MPDNLKNVLNGEFLQKHIAEIDKTFNKQDEDSSKSFQFILSASWYRGWRLFNISPRVLYIEGREMLFFYHDFLKNYILKLQILAKTNKLMTI